MKTIKLETLRMYRETLNLEILGSERMRGTSLCRSVHNKVNYKSLEVNYKILSNFLLVYVVFLGGNKYHYVISLICQRMFSNRW